MEEQFPVQIRLVGGDQVEIKQELPIDEYIWLPDIDVPPPAKEEYPTEVEVGEEQSTHTENVQETQETNDLTMLPESAGPIDHIEIPDPEIPTEHVDDPVNQLDNDPGKMNRKSLRLRRVVTHRYDPSENQKFSTSTFSCPVCHQKFKKKASMIYHRARHSYLFPIHCNTCYTHFSSKADKIMHENKCNLKRFECYVCAAIASSMHHLKGHMHKHTGEKKFTCSKCDVRFAVKNSLVKHEKTKHQ